MRRIELLVIAIAVVMALSALALSSCQFSGLDVEYGNDTLIIGNGTLELPEGE